MMQIEKISEHLKSIETRGFVELEDVVSDELIKRLDQSIEMPLSVPTINGRKGYVQSGNTRFLFLTLSWAREIIEVYTNPMIIELMDRYAESPVHLSNYRIYRTFPSKITKMQWHVDNKIDTYNSEKNKFEIQMVKKDKGIIMIMYLSDVEDGGLQIVEGSHKWSFEYEKETWDDAERDFEDKIVTFNNRGRGTAILYDYRCIHRAKPYEGGQVRTSLFGQYSPSWMPMGEPILLNTRDISDLSDVQKRVLRFGCLPSSENWPIGNPEEIFDTLGINVISTLKFNLVSQVRNLLRKGF